MPQLFKQVVIAEGVYHEIVEYERAGADQIRVAEWIDIRKIDDVLAVDVLLDELDIGEAETIVLAKEISADIVLMDEKKGRRKIKQLGFRHSGTVGVLLRAKEKGLIELLKPELDQLQRNGFHLSESLRIYALEMSSEAV